MLREHLAEKVEQADPMVSRALMNLGRVSAIAFAVGASFFGVAAAYEASIGHSQVAAEDAIVTLLGLDGLALSHLLEDGMNEHLDILNNGQQRSVIVH